MVRFYELPSTLPAEVKKFGGDIAAYRRGEIHPTQFKGIRVAHGIYEQRKLDTHMVRIRCPGGQVTPAQLRRVAELSHRYGAPHFHVTTRSDVQLHYVDLEDVVAVYEGLMGVGLASRGGGGNTIRNIMASHDSGIAPDEVFDVAPYASALTTRLIAEEDSWNLPRKFKIAFSNSPADNANATITCLGFIARVVDGQAGFRVYVGGGMGAHPVQGQVLYDFVPSGRVYYIARAIKTVFDRVGDRRHKHSARFKFVIEKLGLEPVRAMVDEEIAKLPAGLELQLEPVPNRAPESIDLAPVAVSGPAFEQWKSRYVREQKQAGLFEIKVPLHLGDIWNEDGIALAEFLAPFGENCIRFSLLQNVHLRNIPGAYLGNVFRTLERMHTLSTRPAFVANLVACTGADTCKLGICLPRGVMPAIADRLLASDLDLDALADVKLHISGCPNTCGRHHAADLGFFGKVLRKNGEMLPAYNILAGGGIQDGGGAFAEKVDDIAAKHVPAFVEDLFRVYLSKRAQHAGFRAYVLHGGREDIAALAEKYRELPTIEQDPEFFRDWGTKNDFSLLKGQKAECCAGVFDMIDVDLNAAKAARTEAQAASGAAQDAALQRMLFHCARMLLVTRAIEVRTEEQAFDNFLQHFIESNLVDAKYRPVLLAARAHDAELLRMAQERAYGLVDDLAKLYKSMDDSLKFNVPAVCEPPRADDNTPGFDAASAPTTAAAAPVATTKADVFKDYRGVGCPLNFVKAKLVLEPMTSGQTLELLLDDGDPIENVPNSLKLDGHAILEQARQAAGHWSVVVRKG